MQPRVATGGPRAALHASTISVANRILPRGLGRFVDAAGWMSSGQIEVPFADGRTIRVSLADGYWVPAAFGRPYEPELADALTDLLDPGATFVDCGANIGWWSAFAAVRIGAENVMAIEASSTVLPLLVKNAQLNGGFKVIEAAVWSQRGQVEFATDPHRHAWSSAQPEVRDTLVESGFHVRSVPAVTLDSLGLSGTPIVIKLDVEGAEIAALQGAMDTLRRGCVVIFEEHGRNPDAAVARYLRDVGYDVQPLGLDGGRTDAGRGYNFIARQGH